MLLTAAAVPSTASPRVHFAHEARQHLSSTYTPAWDALMLHENIDGTYPMPAASSVVDLLPSLQNTPGVAVHSNPETTVTEGMGYAMFFAGMQRDVEKLKSLTVAWQANGQAFPDQPACGGCCADGGSAHHPPREICAGPANGLCRRVPGAYMPGWRMPMGDSGAMGSATDADEDAITGLIYLAELTNDVDARSYAVRSIAAFVLEDLGLADRQRNSRRVPVTGDIPDGPLRTIWMWRGGSCWGGYDHVVSEGATSDNRNLCLAPAYFSPGQWRLFAKYLEAYGEEYLPVELLVTNQDLIDVLTSAITWGCVPSKGSDKAIIICARLSPLTLLSLVSRSLSLSQLQSTLSHLVPERPRDQLVDAARRQYMAVGQPKQRAIVPQ